MRHSLSIYIADSRIFFFIIIFTHVKFIERCDGSNPYSTSVVTYPTKFFISGGCGLWRHHKRRTSCRDEFRHVHGHHLPPRRVEQPTRWNKWFRRCRSCEVVGLSFEGACDVEQTCKFALKPALKIRCFRVTCVFAYVKIFLRRAIWEFGVVKCLRCILWLTFFYFW